MRRALSFLPLVLIAVAFVWTQIQLGDRQASTERSVKANCEVVSILLESRANRDKTIKLFASIRRENPKLFDRLVKRAEASDRRLEEVQGDLACKL